MPRLVIVLLLLIPAVLAADRRAKNVILFVADAGGIPTIHAASLHGYGAPRKLFLQRMPHIALSDTSSASRFVTDSAAGMTAIVTGQKTNNNVVGQSASAERGVRDGEPLKTILEYAEEHGLSTGIITNDALTGATPAALYAKATDRALTAVIFQQVPLQHGPVWRDDGRVWLEATANNKHGRKAALTSRA
jgi:alkaline phosphatase